MYTEIKKTILGKIREYDKIFIYRHVRPDGDCVGATKGLCEILRLSFPEKKIKIAGGPIPEYLEFLGSDEEEIDESEYEGALAIVLDTGSADRISNKSYTLCRELIKIDHHIPRDQYGDIQWVEEERSSTCELVADFYVSFKDYLVINSYAATCIYTGMVTDSGRFRFRSVDGDTMRLAGAMLDVGIDVDKLYAELYMKDFGYMKYHAAILSKMKITKNGVAYIVVTREMQEKFNLTSEEASSAVSFLDSIKGSLIWIAFIEGAGDGDAIRVRLRSRFVTVNEIAEKYRGGGHDCACGATVYDAKEMRALIRDADRRLGEYKKNEEGWL